MTWKISPDNPDNWALKTDVFRTTEKSPDGRYYIPIIDLQGNFQARFIAVSIVVNSSFSNWRNGGNLYQTFNLGINPNFRAIYKAINLLINKTTIVEIPLLSTTSYRLVYEPPTWFLDVRVRVWEYIGIIQEDDISDGFQEELVQFLIENLLPLLIQALIPEINNLLLFVIINVLLPAINDLLTGSPPPPALPGNQSNSFYLDNDLI